MWTICVRLAFIPSCLLHTITHKSIWHQGASTIMYSGEFYLFTDQTKSRKKIRQIASKGYKCFIY